MTITTIHYSGLDLKFQSLFYDQQIKRWFIDSQNIEIKFIFYKFPKICIVTYGIILIIKSCDLALKKENYNLQKKLLFLILALIITPLTVAILKHYSPVVCPSRLEVFGGDQIHISPLDIFKDNIFLNGSGKCFPAGHASGGYALISLFFAMTNKKYKNLSLVFSLLLGSIMGLYQIAKGTHYLSDTLTTLTIAILTSLILKKIIKFK